MRALGIRHIHGWDMVWFQSLVRCVSEIVLEISREQIRGWICKIKVPRGLGRRTKRETRFDTETRNERKYVDVVKWDPNNNIHFVQ